MKKELQESSLWLLLLGAMLVSKKERDAALAVIDISDVPAEFVQLWNGIKSGQKTEVHAAFSPTYCQVEGEETCFEALTRAIRELALERYVSKVRSNLEYSKAVTPEQMLDLLDSFATRIRTRQASLAKRPPMPT